MERDLTILLIEDDAAECHAISEYVSHIPSISLVGITNKSTQAINYLIDYRPDAIILDLELHEGDGNGLVFLNNLKSLSLDYVPFILVTTNNNSKIIHRQARALGADFIITKYQDDYSAQHVIEFLKSLKSTILNGKKSDSGLPDPLTAESSEWRAKRIEKRISIEMDLIGISPKLDGRKYLIEAIQLISNVPVSKICSTIAAKYQKTNASIERTMQYAINQAWRTSNIDDLSAHYTARVRSDKGVPTLTEFAYYYADKISKE